MQAHRAVFLDRDGTINVEKEYLFRKEDFEFIPGVPGAVRRLNQAGYLVVVISNQSGIARGLFRSDDVVALHQHIDELLAPEGARIDGYYFCPHHPDYPESAIAGRCQCRKGEPEMLLQAAEDLGIDLGSSYMVGDKFSDLEAGWNAGCRSLLVLTGYGEETKTRHPELDGVFPDLAGAVDHILTGE